MYEREEKWAPSIEIRRLGPLTNLVRNGRQLHYVHIDHLLKTHRHLANEQADADLERKSDWFPEISAAHVADVAFEPVPKLQSERLAVSQTAVPSVEVPVAKTVSEDPEPAHKSVSGLQTVQNQVELPGSEIQPQPKCLDFPVLKNSPRKEEHYYPSREREAPDRLKL